MDPNGLKMNSGEQLWWERTRARGALWYIVSKGLLFLVLFPALGCLGLGWRWEPELLTQGWVIGLISGGFVFMRKELRYRFTLDEEGRPLPDGRSD